MAEFVAGLIDVFADAPMTGNPVAVVQNADELSDEQMRRIAREFNSAETTFNLQSTRADWKLRSFTASGVEVSGAGHNSLGAWLWLAELGDLGSLEVPRTSSHNIDGEVLPIAIERVNGRIHGRMRQSQSRLLDPLKDVIPLAEALGLVDSDILSEPKPRPADAGATHLMVRVLNAGTVDKARPDADGLLAVLRKAQAEACYIYATCRKWSRPSKITS